MLPQFETYGNYSSNNYGAHALRFIGPDGSCFWFSYQTLVAFSKPGFGRIVCENQWGPTTGKHLNWIDGGAKNRRVSASDFQRLYKEAFKEAIAA